ncbi:MAG: hypothetical protein Kow00105_19690 [Phycisphaeraceae bacterium]
MTSGQPGEMGMYHAEISIDSSNQVMVHLTPGMAPAGNTPALPLKFTPDTHPDYSDETASGGPNWTILNGKHYNAQLGWLAGDAGNWTVPDGSAIWIETLEVMGPGTLEVYEGGQGMTSPLLPMHSHTLAPILGIGQPWKWFDPLIVASNTTSPFPASGSGIMVHNWYATQIAGHYEATYRVYVGDAQTAEPDPAYEPAQVTVSWVPEPHIGALMLLGVPALLRCRTDNRVV